MPRVRSVIAVGLVYDVPSDGSEPPVRIARYARGDDYHELMSDRLDALASALDEVGHVYLPFETLHDVLSVLSNGECSPK